MRAIYVFTLSMFTFLSNAQNPLIWSTDLFCENANSGANAVTKPVFDATGNIYVAGSLMLEEEGYNRTPVVVKLNPDGDTLWRYEHQRPNVPFPFTASYFSDIAIDATGNIFAVGLVPDTTMAIYAKPIIVKIDPNGNLIWERKMFENIPSDNTVAGVLTVDNQGSAYFTGRKSITFQQYEAFIWKIASDGNLVWTHTYTINLYRTSYYNIVLNTAQDKLYVTGDVLAFNGQQKLNLIEIINSSDGVVIKSLRNSTTPNSETEHTAIDASENLYVSLYDLDGGAIIKKYDDTLGLIYTYRYFPEGSYDNSFAKILTRNEGEIFAAGYSYANSNASSGRAFFVRLSSDGSLYDEFVFPSTVEEYIYDCVEIDSETVCVGTTVNENNDYAIKVWRIYFWEGYMGNFVYSKSEINSSEAFWVAANDESAFVTGTLRTNTSGGFSIIKLDPYQIYQNISELDKSIDFSVYPNPFVDQIHFDLSINHPVQAMVLNTIGQVVYQAFIPNHESLTYLNLANLPSGMYYLKILNNNEKNFQTKKIVKM